MNEADQGVATLKAWVGRSQTVKQTLDARSVISMAATLGVDDLPTGDGAPLPPGWHWMMFTTFLPVSELAPDGLPKGGGFLPPVKDMGRMWAGGRVSWSRPMLVGKAFERKSTIANVEVKEGRSGRLIIVTTRHEISDAQGLCMAEEQDVVFRKPPSPGGTPAAPPKAPDGAHWTRTVTPDPVLLFRFSALTFNAHRIHFDHPYTTQVEKYPGLLVHGPLIASFLLDTVRRQANNRPLARFSFRAISPLYDTAPFEVQGTIDGAACRVWARNASGGLAMDANGEFLG